MLGKLIKYDFKAMAGSMFPIYAAMLSLTVVFSLMVKFHLDEGFIFGIFAFLFITAMMGSVFACIFFVVARFSNGLLKNEGYLSFALPVDTATHILAKVINAVIWALVEGLSLILCMLIMGLIFGLAISDLLKAFNLVNIDMLLEMFRWISIMMLEIIASVCLVYAALAVSHLFDKHKRMIEVAFIIVMIVIRSNLMGIFLANADYSSFESSITIFRSSVWFILPICFALLYSLITWYILDKRLNLE